MSDFGAIISALGAWLLSVLTFLPKLVFQLLFVALGNLISAIPVPAWLSAAPAYVAAIPPEVLFFTSPLNLQYGFTVMISALTIRFLIRRLPFIG